jgi:hypothetical protein
VTPRATLLGAALIAAVSASSAGAQTTIGLEAGFKGYSFDEGLGPKAAQLLIVPLAVRVPLSATVQTDLYAAWAEGQVERAGSTYRLSGLVDTQLKTSWTAAPWAVLSLGLSLPTGHESHDAEESVVAAVLATDLLGFRESTWGTGLAVTTGVATATRFGQWGVGMGASYRMANGFEPSADQGLTYEPGNEARVRLGLDRNVGETGKLSAGVTLQKFSEDQVDGRNLFQAGNRLMVDGSYAFRLGSQTWTLYGSDLWREQGDLFLSVIDGAGKVVGDSTVVTGSQNLLSLGVTGAIPIGSIYRLRPGADLRVQSREEQTGSSEGSGWMMGLGADFPLRLFGTYDVFPRARFTLGGIEGADGEGHAARGGEFGITVRWGS